MSRLYLVLAATVVFLLTSPHHWCTSTSTSTSDRTYDYDDGGPISDLEQELELVDEQYYIQRELEAFADESLYGHGDGDGDEVSPGPHRLSDTANVIDSISNYNHEVPHILPENELQALRDLYTSLNGTRWKWSYRDGDPWDFSANASSPCGGSEGSGLGRRWDGIKCTCNITTPAYPINGFYYYDDNYRSMNNSANCRVAKIYLSKHNLEGTLPVSLFTSFKNLTRLHLGYNSISGTIPSYAAMTHDFQLSIMDLSRNSLHGILFILTEALL